MGSDAEHERTPELHELDTVLVPKGQHAHELFEADSPPPALGPGATFGPLRIVAELGRGGMGVVYRAEQSEPRRMVALKVLVARLAGSADALYRWDREVRSVGAMQHENIVRVYLSGVIDGLPYYAMELVEGPPLAEALCRGPLPPEEAARIAAQVARGLAYAHKRGVIHRDIKPGNILLGEGRAMITDFGLARQQTDLELTRSGVVVGTPVYASPEQLKGDVDAQDTRSDLYSLGATLYHMLTGRLRFEATELVQIVAQVFNEPLVPPRRWRPELPADLDQICVKLLALEPDERYQTADAAADDLERFLAGDPLSTAQPTAWFRLRRWAGRNPMVAALAAALVLLTAGFISLYLLRITREKQRLERAQRELTRALDRERSLSATLRGSLQAIQAERLLGRATELVQQGAERREVEALARQAAVLAPDHPLLARLRGWLALDRRRWAEAERLLRKALAGRPDDYLTHYLLYRWYFDQGHGTHDEALQLIDAMERFGADTAVGWWSKARRLEVQMRRAPPGKRAALARRIVECCDRAIALSARLSLAYNLRAMARIELGQHDAASADLQRYSQLTHPRSAGRAEAHFMTGKLHEARKQYREAAAAYTRAIAITPRHHRAWLERGRSLLKLGRIDQALRNFTEGIRLAPRFFKGYQMRGTLYGTLGRDREALVDLEQAIRLAPGEAGPSINRGNLHLARGRLADALRDYDRAVQVQPSAPLAHYNRGLLHGRMGQLSRATADHRAAVVLDPGNATLHYGLGNALDAQKLYGDAVEVFGRALQLQPGHLQARNNRGLALQRAGQLDAARADFDEALRRDPRFLPSLINRGNLNAEQRRYREALADFKAALPLTQGAAKQEVEQAVRKMEAEVR